MYLEVILSYLGSGFPIYVSRSTKLMYSIEFVLLLYYIEYRLILLTYLL